MWDKGKLESEFNELDLFRVELLYMRAFCASDFLPLLLTQGVDATPPVPSPLHLFTGIKGDPTLPFGFHLADEPTLQLD